MKNQYKKLRILFLILFTSLSLGLRAEDDDDDHNEDEEEEFSHMEEESNANELREEIREFLNEEEGEELMQFVEKEMPKGTAAYINQLIVENPYEAYEALEYLMETRNEYLELKEVQPEVAKDFLDYNHSETASYMLAMKIEKSDGKNDEALKKKLRGEIEKAFDLRLTLQKAELANLEDEVEELRTLLKKRETAREAVIERRFKELTGENEHLEW